MNKVETGAKSSVDVATSDLITAPLTKALAKLSGEDDDEGKYLRPEFYSQHDLREKNRDHNKLDCIGLFYGWTCVARHLLTNEGTLGATWTI